MKRKFALILSAVMAASSLPLTAYAANFKDINDVPWAGAETVINSVADKGLLSGYEDGTFRAKNNVTYCEAMQMVYNVLVKTGVAKSMDAVEAYAYMGTLDTYQVPKWAQMAVAYGLKNGIIDMQLVATKFAGGNTAATREDVALLFGNALGMYYDKEKDAAEAKKFADYWSISGERLVQIDLLKRLGVVSGDNYNNFNPKKNINRAEMAVMLNKTNGILTEGVEESGTITNITVNENKYYNFTVRMTQGGTENVMATLGQMPVYSGNTTQTVALSSLNKGDQVSLIRSGNSVIAMRVTKGSTAQSKYDMTGYVDSYKNDSLSFENENTGETVKYPIKSGAKIVVGGHVFYLITIIGDQSHLKIGHYRIRFQCFLFIIITGARHFCNTDDIFMISQQRQVFYIFSRLSCLGEIHPIISCRRFSGTPSSYNQTHSVFTARSSVIATGIIYGSRGFESIDVADIGRIACYKIIIGRIDAHFLIIGNRNIKIT